MYLKPRIEGYPLILANFISVLLPKNQCLIRRHHSDSDIIMPSPTLKKWGHIDFGLSVCVCVGGGGGGEVASRYRLETSCMDSSWKNSRRIFLVFPELSPLVKLRPFDKQGDEIL